MQRSHFIMIMRPLIINKGYMGHKNNLAITRYICNYGNPLSMIA